MPAEAWSKRITSSLSCLFLLLFVCNQHFLLFYSGLNCNHPLICNLILFRLCTIVLYHCHGGYIWLDDSVRKRCFLDDIEEDKRCIYIIHFCKFALRVFLHLLEMQREYWVEENVKKAFGCHFNFSTRYTFWLFCSQNSKFLSMFMMLYAK